MVAAEWGGNTGGQASPSMQIVVTCIKHPNTLEELTERIKKQKQKSRKKLLQHRYKAHY